MTGFVLQGHIRAIQLVTVALERPPKVKGFSGRVWMMSRHFDALKIKPVFVCHVLDVFDVMAGVKGM